MKSTPPPPIVGQRFSGPSRSDRERSRGAFGGVYHVRAIVDAHEDPAHGWTYQVVLRRYSDRRGWQYSMEDELAFTLLTGDRATFAPASPPRRRVKE